MADRREYYYQKAQKLRHIMDEYHCEAMRNHTAVNEDWYVKQDELLKVIRNYRAYCRRNNFEYNYNDI